MKVLIAAAIFGISCGIYGCSNEANLPGRPTGAAEAPASSPGFASQTAADANAEVEIPAVVNQPAVIPPTAVNPPVAAPSNWVDVTTVGPNLTLQDPLTGLSWSNMRPNANWWGAIDHCSALTYNGVSGWRLPTQKELLDAYAHGIKIAARANWMTLANMQAGFWSASSYSDGSNNAWVVNLGNGNTYNDFKHYTYAVVCVR